MTFASNPLEHEIVVGSGLALFSLSPPAIRRSQEAELIDRAEDVRWSDLGLKGRVA